MLFGTCVIAAVHRYRRVSTPEQRLQTRGVVAAIVLWFVVALLSVAHAAARACWQRRAGQGLVANAVLVLGSYLVIALLPASIAVAVLRYRLYEVDVWVNRALVYGALTAVVLALIRAARRPWPASSGATTTSPHRSPRP